ncbi:secretory phospholipase A2 receptor [Lissotriton helveticus]
MLRDASLAWWVLTMLTSSWGSAGEDAVLSLEQLSNFFSREMFIMRSEQLNMCIRVDTSGIVLANCSQPSLNMLWKWVSENHLFNYGTKHCLGLNVLDKERPLRMSECDNNQVTFLWDCHDNELISRSNYRLVPENGQVVARRRSHKWKHFTTQNDDLCVHPFQEIYTLRGNSFGAPCVFPFKFKNIWYPECIKEGRDGGLLWCSTSAYYDRDTRWGFCPIDDPGCSTFWRKRPDMDICYHFSLSSSLSWREARSACQALGGDLLSITDLPEQEYVSERLSNTGIYVWTGLNNLGETTGWQWSDGSPLALVNWEADKSRGPSTREQCGLLPSWRTLPCKSRLPYVCKKYLNHTINEPFDAWKYYPTHCDSGWFAYNRNCYKLQTEKQSWINASSSCNQKESELISIASLADVELLITLLHNENVTETWIGLMSNATLVMFKWNDGTPVTLTNWHIHEPNIIMGVDHLCVSAHETEGLWNVRRCEEEIVSVCKKAGHVQEASVSEKDIDCHEEWERRGEFCYRIDNTSRSFENASSGHHCPLLTVTNRFEQAFVKSMIYNLVTSEDSYIWIALQDENSTGEYRWKTNKGSPTAVRYTNWNKYQPSRSGGCIAMRSGSQAGRWEVKDCQSFEAMSFCKQKLNEEKQISENSDSGYFNDNFNEDSCVHGWESEAHLHNCYKVFHIEKVLMKRTWDEAEEFCQGYGAHLASFSSGDEEIFLDKLLSTMFSPTDRRRFWIGLNRRNPLSGGSWEWSDGTPVISPFLQDMYIDSHVKLCATNKADNRFVPLDCAAKLEWICSISKGVDLKIPDWHVRELPWMFFRGANYFFYGDASKFVSFKFACGWLGGSLLTIHSLAEQEFIADKLKKLSKGRINWWIGLLAENPGDQFRWEDRLPLVYQNWDSERNRTVPVNKTRCGYISKETGLWGDIDCKVDLPGICKSTRTYWVEKEIKKDKQQNISDTQHGECPKEWLYFENKCFLVKILKDNGHSEDWFSAHAYCSNHDGRLASVENKMEQAFITMQLFGHKSSIWIGKHKTEISSENVDTLKYSNWSPKNIIQQHADGHSSAIPQQESLCTLMSNNHNVHITGKWYLDNCNKKGYGFVCEKEQDTSKRTVPESDMYPLPDVLEYGNRTYRILRGNMSWTEAMNICLQNGEQLVSITDQYYQAFLTIIVNRIGYPHWIGFSTVHEDADFEWSDGTRSLFTSWKDDGSQYLGECAYIDTDGDWNADDCETILQGAVCHVPLEQRIPTNRGICPDTDVQWIPFKNNCYSVSTVLNGTMLPEAYRFCKQQGSDLLSIKDNEENTFLVQELQHLHSPIKFIWLSIIYKQESDSVMWYDDTPLNYSNWAAGEPEWNRRAGLCAAVAVQDGEWLAIDCADETGFICKAHAVKEDTMYPNEASYHGIIPLAVVVVIIVVLILSSMWCVYKRDKCHAWRIPFFKPTESTPASDFEENILITELETNH